MGCDDGWVFGYCPILLGLYRAINLLHIGRSRLRKFDFERYDASGQDQCGRKY